jgi:hypothetical protein
MYSYDRRTASLVWTDLGAQVVKLLKTLSKESGIAWGPLSPTKVGYGYGNSLLLQYLPKASLPDDWAEDLSPQRVTVLLAKYNARTPEEAVANSQRDAQKDLQSMQRRWEHVASQIEAIGRNPTPVFKCTVESGSGLRGSIGALWLNLDVKGPFTAVH